MIRLTRLIYQTQTKNYGSPKAWSLANQSSYKPCTLCKVEIEIEGNPKRGFSLLISPDGFSTADYWFETLEEALECGINLVGASISEWQKIE